MLNGIDKNGVLDLSDGNATPKLRTHSYLTQVPERIDTPRRNSRPMQRPDASAMALVHHVDQPEPVSSATLKLAEADLGATGFP